MNREIACILQSMGFPAAWMVAATIFLVGLLYFILSALDDIEKHLRRIAEEMEKRK